MPNRQELLDRHPCLAGDLLAFFADHDRMQQFAEPMRPATPAPHRKQKRLCSGRDAAQRAQRSDADCSVRCGGARETLPNSSDGIPAVQLPDEVVQ